MKSIEQDQKPTIDLGHGNTLVMTKIIKRTAQESVIKIYTNDTEEKIKQDIENESNTKITTLRKMGQRTKKYHIILNKFEQTKTNCLNGGWNNQERNQK